MTASATPLRLLLVTVPKHTSRSIGAASPASYFFEESQLRSLVDEKRIRERTFWVNKETGLSGAWDLQIGRMAIRAARAVASSRPSCVEDQSDHAGAFLPD